ncbi:MAG: hypothetical protein LIO91_13630 [Bacteroidales bacterium]|nr:hypothetical protein [Bacteroidales bacterium]
MKLFNKKPPTFWWALDHPSDHTMSRVEKALHDNCLAYRYDNLSDSFYVAIQLMDHEPHPHCFVLERTGGRKIRIVSCSDFPLTEPEERHGITRVLKEISAESEFVSLSIEEKSGRIIGEHVLKIPSTDDGAQYVVPVMMEHARVMDTRYNDIKGAYLPVKYRYISSYDDFFKNRVTSILPLNKIYYINGERAINHQPHLYSHLV